MRRLGVFVFFDPQGIVDDYVLHLLGEMCTVCTEIVTVCNGELTKKGFERIHRYSKTIFTRENWGMDAGALKDYFTHLGEKEYWRSFDELVWFNDTCYGPLHSMKNVFQEMDRRRHSDFWGITMHAKSNAKWPSCKEPGIPAHLQSYFIVVKQPLLSDERFYSFWKEMDISNDFNKTVANYELSLTRVFLSWGYTCGVYCNTIPYDTNPDCVCNLTADGMYMLVSQYHCPFVKRKSFIRSKAETLIHTNGEQAQRVMQYIKESTDYNCSLIYKNLLRLYDYRIWQGNLGHNYILSAESSHVEINCAALILAELNHEDTIFELVEYLSTLPKGCSLIAVTSCDELQAKIAKHLPITGVYLTKRGTKGMEALFDVLKQINIERYEYFCFLPEYWEISVNDLHLQESSVRYSIYGNMVKSSHLICNILQLFQAEKELGVLTPQLPSNLVDYKRYTKEAICAFGIIPPNRFIEKSTNILAAWCRKEIVNSVLLNPNIAKSGETGRLLCFVGQSIGYFSASVTEERQAACISDNQRWVIDSINSGLDSINLLWYSKAYQNIAEINAGKADMDNLQMRLSHFVRLTFMAVIFFFEKKLNLRISTEKRQAFFLGVRDIFNAYRRVRKSCQNRKKHIKKG